MKYPVLGFLFDQPMHGYALKCALSPALPPGQTVNDGILYPLLKVLTGRWREPSPLVYILAALFVFRFIYLGAG